MIRTYPRETVIAEKLHAMVDLGMANSRLKDFFDLFFLAQHFSFNGLVLQQAIAATLERRGTTIPAVQPLALTVVFSNEPRKQLQWNAFLKRTTSNNAAPDLPSVIQHLSDFLLPILLATSRSERWAGQWAPGGPWLQP